MKYGGGNSIGDVPSGGLSHLPSISKIHSQFAQGRQSALYVSTQKKKDYILFFLYSYFFFTT